MEKNDKNESVDSTDQNSRERRSNKTKKPDKQIYRPPPASGRSKRGDGDGSSMHSLADQKKEEKSAPNSADRPEQHSRINPTTDGKRNTEFNQGFTTIQRANSDVGIGDRRGFDNFRQNNKRGGGGARGGFHNTGESRNYGYRRGSEEKPSFDVPATGKRYSVERSTRQRSEFHQEPSSADQEEDPHSEESHPVYHSYRGQRGRGIGGRWNNPMVNGRGGYDRGQHHRGGKNREFSKTGSGYSEFEGDWRQFAHSNKSNERKSVHQQKPAGFSRDIPKERSVPPLASSSPPVSVGSVDRPPVNSTITAFEQSDIINLSWGEEVEKEELEQAAKARADISAVQLDVSSNHTTGSVQRGGLIQMNAAMATAMHQDQTRRNPRGRGGMNSRGHRPPYNHYSTLPRGGGRFPTTSSTSAFDGRVYISDTPNNAFRMAPPDYYAPNAVPSFGERARPASTGSAQVSQQEREANNVSIVPSQTEQIIMKLEDELAHLTQRLKSSKPSGIRGELDRIMRCKSQLTTQFMPVVTGNIRNEGQRVLEQRLWKQVFYHPIEALRSVMATAGSEQSFCRDTLLSMIEEGTEFYQGLIAHLEGCYAFKLDRHCYSMDDKLATVLPCPPTIETTVKYALACCQRYLVSLGDLARYRELIKETSNFGTARLFYNKAAQLAPTNGRAHNQLALLAMYTNRWLDAVFYYVRSLAAKHPFFTAKESLLSLFEDVRQKVDHYETSRKHELEQLMRLRRSQSGRRGGRRLNQREIWKFPDGSESSMKSEELESQELEEMTLLTKFSAQELHKRCCAYLLRAAGILFSKINVDLFESVAELALVQFRALLKLDESPLAASMLVELTVISLFLIHYTSGGETERESITTVQNFAFQLSFSMFGLLLERLEEILRDDTVLRSPPSKELHLLLPSARIFCMWMSDEVAYKLYEGLSSMIGGIETERFAVSMWDNFAKVVNLINSYSEDGKLKVIDRSKDDGHAPGGVIMPEDLLITSFFDVFHSKPATCHLSKEIPQELAAEHFRLNWLSQLAAFLDGMNCPMLTLRGNGEYVASSRSTSPGAGRIRTNASDEENESSETRTSLDSSKESAYVGDMSQLRLLQKASEAKQAFVEQESQRMAEIIVEPHHLVIDTNTFVDHRRLVNRIVEEKYYKIFVPFVVFNELLGLVRNPEKWTREQATLSLKMIRDWTKGTSSPYAPFVQGVTTSGQILDFDYHNNEADDSTKKNDDKILECCRNLTAAYHDGFGAKREIRDLKYEPISIYRKVVLLTGDKNLALKARGEDVPVMEIERFVKLARLVQR